MAELHERNGEQGQGVILSTPPSGMQCLACPSSQAVSNQQGRDTEHGVSIGWIFADPTAPLSNPVPSNFFSAANNITRLLCACALLFSAHGGRAGAKGIGSFGDGHSTLVGLARSKTCRMVAILGCSRFPADAS